MRRRVSGETPTVNWVGVKEVMVRHVPGFTEQCQRKKGVWDDKVKDGTKATTRRQIMEWRTIYTDTIAQVGICEDLGAVGDCQRSSPSAGCGVILFFEAGDGWLG